MARGLIEGAIGGLAKAAGDIAGGHIKSEMELDFRKQISDMEEQRQLRIAEAQERIRRAGRQADFDQGLANAPRATQARIDELKATKPVETELEAERARKVGAAKGETEREQDAAFAKDPGAQAGVRARAQAADTGAAERGLRLKELQLKIDDLKATAEEKKEMRAELKRAADLKAAGKDDEAQKIIDTLRVRTGVDAKKSGEKSYSDAVGAARVLNKAAEDAELDNPEEAARLRREAADIVRGVASKRGVQPPPAAPTVAVPPTPAVNHLKRHPELADAFDQKYGAGAAARALGPSNLRKQSGVVTTE